MKKAKKTRIEALLEERKPSRTCWDPRQLDLAGLLLDRERPPVDVHTQNSNRKGNE